MRRPPGSHNAVMLPNLTTSTFSSGTVALAGSWANRQKRAVSTSLSNKGLLSSQMDHPLPQRDAWTPHRRTPPPRDRPPADRPKFRSFFPSPFFSWNCVKAEDRPWPPPFGPPPFEPPTLQAPFVPPLVRAPSLRGSTITHTSLAKAVWPKMDWPKMDWPRSVKSGWAKNGLPQNGLSPRLLGAQRDGQKELIAGRAKGEALWPAVGRNQRR